MYRNHHVHHYDELGSSLGRKSRLSDDYDDYRFVSNRSAQSSQSPYRDDTQTTSITSSYDEYIYDPDTILRLKWLDQSPRMSRMRENRQKRLINKLEQFELWDIEQEQKQKQYELAREQRYKNIVERLKSQDFCVNLMKRRHESDLETTRELDNHPNVDHLYVDPLDDPKNDIKGPLTQYRKFQYEMDNKLKNLQTDLDTLNPRFKIEQAILPRIERTREMYSVEPEVFTRKGKRVLKKPNLKQKVFNSSNTSGSIISLSNESESERLLNNIEASLREPTRRLRNLLADVSSVSEKPRLKPIIHLDDANKSMSRLSLSSSSPSQSKKMVNFNDQVEYGSQ